MNVKDRNDRADVLFSDCLSLLDKKGADYAINQGAFENFEMIADAAGITREQVLQVLMTKHLFTIKKVILGGKSTTEPIRQRIIDVINYLAILEAMLSENDSTDPSS